jgi:surface antigen
MLVSVPAPTQAGHGSHRLDNGETLFANQWLRSPNQVYYARMQPDGNFVLYQGSTTSQPKWSTRTSGQTGAHVSMQSDGNLVLYRNGSPIWFTGTQYGSNTYLEAQNDGNLVLYQQFANGTRAARWAKSWHSVWGITRSTNPGDAGNCTWYAAERFKQFSGVYPNVSGDAHNWNDAAVQNGWLVFSTPKTQAVVVWEPSTARPFGHLGWVNHMKLTPGVGTEIHISEMNRFNLYEITHRWVTHGPDMSYIMAPQL